MKHRLTGSLVLHTPLDESNYTFTLHFSLVLPFLVRKEKNCCSNVVRYSWVVNLENALTAGVVGFLITFHLILIILCRAWSYNSFEFTYSYIP